MNPGRVHRAIAVLRIVLGIVVLIQSVQALVPRETGLHSPRLARVLPILAGVEILGALLMLVPRMARVGAGVLIGVFAAAILLHGLHGDWNVGGLVVYAACAWVVRAAAAGPRAIGATT
jgi:uncharacterized membrane protein YphA (DoxX/SURF4 family)